VIFDLFGHRSQITEGPTLRPFSYTKLPYPKASFHIDKTNNFSRTRRIVMDKNKRIVKKIRTRRIVKGKNKRIVKKIRTRRIVKNKNKKNL